MSTQNISQQQQQNPEQKQQQQNLPGKDIKSTTSNLPQSQMQQNLPEGQQMSQLQGQSKEGLSDIAHRPSMSTFLSRPFFSSMNWPVSIWEEFKPLEEELDNKFKYFEDEMEKTRNMMLEDMKKVNKDLVAKGNTYVRQQSNVESSQITVEGHTLRFRIINFNKEKDGISMPHLHKQIFCSPPAPIDLIRNNSSIWETIGGYDQKVLTQFMEDSKNFEDKFRPDKVWRFENVISMDPKVKQNDYVVKVWFESKDGYRLLYNFGIPHGAANGNYKLDKTSFDLADFQERTL